MLHHANDQLYEAVKAAFRGTRRSGVIARMSFSCCQSCGSYELAQRNKSYVFYHRQSAEAWKRKIDERNVLYVYFSDLDAARTLVVALERHHVHVVWNGTEGQAIGIVGMVPVLDLREIAQNPDPRD